MIRRRRTMARRTVDLETIRRRIARSLGRRGRGKFVAIDRNTGDYLVAGDLDALAAALSRIRGKVANFRIIRLGFRAAIELRPLR